MQLWIGNIHPDVPDEQLCEFVEKYGCPHPSEIQRVPGDGTRPAAILNFEGAVEDKVSSAQMRLHGMFWHNRELNVQTLMIMGGPTP